MLPLENVLAIKSEYRCFFLSFYLHCTGDKPVKFQIPLLTHALICSLVLQII